MAVSIFRNAQSLSLWAKAKGNIANLVISQQIGITMPLSDPAFETLQKLLQLDPDDLALNRDRLANVLGISAPTLIKRLAELMACGLVKSREFRAYCPSGIAITDRGYSYGKESNTCGALPYGKESNPGGKVGPEKVANPDGSKIPPFKTLPKNQRKSQYLIPVSGISLPSVVKGSDEKLSHALSSAVEQKPDCWFPVVKLDGQDVTPNQVYSNSLAGKLSTAAKDTLLGWRKSPHRIIWYQAFLRGLSDRIRTQWADRVGHRKIAANANGTPEKWKQIALTVLALDVEPDYFLDVAFDCCPKRFAYPTVSYLASEFLKSAVPAWVPKDQRGGAQHEESIEEILKRSREAIEWAEAHNPAPVPTKMWFDRNWPGLWGREDNRRPEMTAQENLEPGDDV